MPSDIFPLETNKRIDRRSACQLSPHLTNASATVTSSSSLPLSMLHPLRSVSRTSYNSYTTTCITFKKQFRRLCLGTAMTPTFEVETSIETPCLRAREPLPPCLGMYHRCNEGLRSGGSCHHHHQTGDRPRTDWRLDVNDGKLLNVKMLHNRWEIKAPPRRRAPLRSITETCCILLAGGLDGWQVNQQVSNN